MATKLYLRNTNANIGSLTEPELSTALPVGTRVNANANGPLDLSETIGSSATSVTEATAATGDQDLYFARWVSPALAGISTLNANTWTLAISAQEGNAAQNAFLIASIYVVTASNTVRGYVYDDHTSLGGELSANSTTCGAVRTVSGSQVTGIQATDKLVFEGWFHTNPSMTTSYIANLHYDGPNDVTEGASTKGSYISTPQNNLFTAVNNWQQPVNENASQVTDASARKPGVASADAIQGTDETTRPWTALRTQPDAVQGVDQATPTWTALRTQDDPIAATDSIQAGLAKSLTIDDSISVADEAAGGVAFVQASSGAVGSGDITLDKPTGTVEGDVMIAAVTRSALTPPTPPDAGWELITDEASNLSGASLDFSTWRKVAGSSEPATYTWGTGSKSAAGIATYRGVDGAAPVDVADDLLQDASLPLSSPIVSPDVTASIAGMLVFGGGELDGLTVDFPGGSNERVDVTTDLTATGRWAGMGDEQLSETGATGQRSITPTAGDKGGGSVSSVVGFALVLTPAAQHLSKHLTRSIDDSIGATDALAGAVGQTTSDAIQGTDSTQLVEANALTQDDAASLSDFCDPQLTQASTATYISVELMQGATVISSSGTLDLSADTAWHDGVLNVSESEAANITDYSALRLRFTGWSDGMDPNVSFAELELPGGVGSKFRRVQNDAGQLSDAVVVEAVLGQAIDDALGAADQLSTAWVAQLAEVDGAELSDSISTISAYKLTLTDGVQGTDQVAVALERVAEIADYVQGTDEATPAVQFVRAQDDLALLTDGQSLAEQNQQGIADGAQLTDACDPQLLTQARFKNLDDTIQGTDAAQAAAAHAVADGIQGTDAVQEAMGRSVTVADDFQGADETTRPWTALRSQDDGAALTDGMQVVSGLAAHIDESLSGTDSVSSATSWVRAVDDTATVGDSVSISLRPSVADDISATDQLSHAWTAHVAVDDAIQGIDSTQLAEANAVTQDDAAALSDSADRVVSAVRAVEDAASASDSLQLTVAYALVIEDSVAATDEFVRTVESTRTLADAIQGTDDIDTSIAGAKTKSLSEFLGVTDSVGRIVAAARAVVDALTATDSVATRHTVVLGDSVAATDQLDHAAASTRTLADDIQGTDSTQLAEANAVTQSDTASLTDSEQHTVQSVRAVADQLRVSDDIETGITGAKTKSLSDSFFVTDEVQVGVGHALVIEDSAAATDEFTRTVASVRHRVDRIRCTDEIQLLPSLRVYGVSPRMGERGRTVTGPSTTRRMGYRGQRFLSRR